MGITVNHPGKTYRSAAYIDSKILGNPIKWNGTK